MKKVLLIAGILLANSTFAQLYTQSGAIQSTTNSSSANVGIGTASPLANLHLVSGFSTPDQTGDLIIGNVNYPNLRFGVSNQYSWIQSHAGSPLYINYLGNNNLIFNHTGGNVGIGTEAPSQKLDVRGNILAGASDATEGINAFAIRYADGSLSNWGSLRSSAATYMSFGVKADNINGGWLSSNGTLNFAKVAMTMGNEGFDFWTSPQQQIALDSPVSMTPAVKITTNGNLGIGTISPAYKLDVKGTISSQDNTNEGGAIVLDNTTKTNPNTARKWVIYNMTGPYGNSLQFWNYSADGAMYGSRLKLSDDGNMALYGKFEAKEVKVTLTPTADFVFEEDYTLPKLEDVEKHIKEKKHLPEIASAKVMEKEGVNVGEFQIKLLQKIEELTLYSIEQNKQIKKLQEENKTLQSQSEKIERLEKQLEQLLSNQK